MSLKNLILKIADGCLEMEVLNNLLNVIEIQITTCIKTSFRAIYSFQEIGS